MISKYINYFPKGVFCQGQWSTEPKISSSAEPNRTCLKVRPNRTLTEPNFEGSKVRPNLGRTEPRSCSKISFGSSGENSHFNIMYHIIFQYKHVYYRLLIKKISFFYFFININVIIIQSKFCEVRTSIHFMKSKIHS